MCDEISLHFQSLCIWLAFVTAWIQDYLFLSCFWGSYCTLQFASLSTSSCPFKVTLSCDRLHSTSPPLHYTMTPSETCPLIKSGLCQPPSHALAPHLPATPATPALLLLKLSPELHPANEHCQVRGEGLEGCSGFIYQLHFISALF